MLRQLLLMFEHYDPSVLFEKKVLPSTPVARCHQFRKTESKVTLSLHEQC